MSKESSNTSEKSQEITLSDAIMGVFSGLKQVGKEIITTQEEDRFSIEATHRAFSRLTEEFPQCFSELSFQQGFVPFSERLEQMLFRLGSSGLVVIDGTFRNYSVRPEAKAAMKQSLEKRYGRSGLRSFAALSQRFNALI